MSFEASKRLHDSAQRTRIVGPQTCGQPHRDHREQGAPRPLAAPDANTEGSAYRARIGERSLLHACAGRWEAQGRMDDRPDKRLTGRELYCVVRPAVVSARIVGADVLVLTHGDRAGPPGAFTASGVLAPVCGVAFRGASADSPQPGRMAAPRTPGEGGGSAVLKPRSELTFEDVRRKSTNQRPVNVEEEVTELVALCPCDIFSVTTISLSSTDV